MAKKLSKEEWEQRVREAGAGRYEFVGWLVDGEFGCKKKCLVRCSKDGYEWSAEVGSLVNNGRGCPQCAGQRRWKEDERIEQINSLENIEFVSWVDGYDSAHSKANVKCAVDDFEWSSTVTNLVNGNHGCPNCSGKRRWTSEERVEQINSLDNIEFVSWIGNYNNCESKAKVRCTLDYFEWGSTVDNLVNGVCGCPRCAKYGYDKSKSGTIYALRSECGMYVKVGISNKPSQRHRRLELATPFSFSCIERISGDGTKIAELEKYFHDNYERAGFTGFDGCTEWLICTPQLLEELRELEDVK